MDTQQDTHLTVPIDDLSAIHIEIWRLEQLVAAASDSGQAGALRRICRKLQAAVSETGIETVDMVGRRYDPGMAPDVLDVEFDSGAVYDVVAATVEPTLLLNGRVVNRGQIILRKPASLAPDAEEPAQ